MENTPTTGRPVAVTAVIILIFGNALLGLIVATFGLYMWEDALSAIGFVLAAGAFWVIKGLLDKQDWAWSAALFLNIIAIPLYLVSFAWLEGLILCLLSIVYLIMPQVRQHFNQ